MHVDFAFFGIADAAVLLLLNSTKKYDSALLIHIVPFRVYSVTRKHTN
jgi:hypothetical protein